MSLTLALLLQVTVIQPPKKAEPFQCSSGKEAVELFKPTTQAPTPMGMIVGAGSDWGTKYLVVHTTNYLAVPGIKTRQGSTTVTYYQTFRDHVCTRELTKTNCSALDSALNTLKNRSYAVMNNRTELREGYAYHPPFAVLHVQDGDGNITKISSNWPGHPVMDDVYLVFKNIERCTADIEKPLHEL